MMESHGKLADSIIGNSEKEMYGYIYPHISKKKNNESAVNTVVQSEKEQLEEQNEGEGK